MTADTFPGLDRIVPESTLWESWTGTDSSTIGVLFSRAADLIDRKGYHSYGSEDPADAQGRVSLYDAISEVVAEHAEHQGRADSLIWHDHDRTALAEEMQWRLAGVLHITGQCRDSGTGRSLGDKLFAWLRDAVRFEMTGGNRYGLYHGQADVCRLLRLASVMTVTVDTL